MQSDLPKAGTDGADGTRRPHAPAAMPVTAVAQSAMADASVVQPQAAEGGSKRQALLTICPLPTVFLRTTDFN